MMGFLTKFLLKLISTELTKTVISYGINKLLESKSDGITKDIIKVVIDGAVESKKNNLKDEDVFHIRNVLNS